MADDTCVKTTPQQNVPKYNALIDNTAGGKQAHGACDVEITTAGRCFLASEA